MANATAQTVAWASKYAPFGVSFAVTATTINNQRLPWQLIGDKYQLACEYRNVQAQFGFNRARVCSN